MVECLKMKKNIGKPQWKVFVAMPFTPDLDDIYYLGIQPIVSNLGGECIRIDEIKHTDLIANKIRDLIKQSDILVAEISFINPNVYYEIGIAHGLRKPAILITRNMENTPFDLQGYKHITYRNIVELRDKLYNLVNSLLYFDISKNKRLSTKYV